MMRIPTISTIRRSGVPVGGTWGAPGRASAARVVVAAVAVVGLACSPARPDRADQAGATASASALDLATATIVDLSHAYDETTLYWPTSPSAFELETLHHGPTPAGFFYSANALATPEHGGTHLDAPIHFGEGGWTAGEIPLDRLIGPAAVIDVSAQAAEDLDYRLTVEDVRAWEARHGDVAEGTIVLVRTGWSSRWPDRLAYLGDDTPGDASNLHFPGCSEEAARYLAEERRVAVVGIDTASIDYGPSQFFLAHQVLAAANVAVLENVANLEGLPAIGAWVVALPMKISQGSGGPVRIAALVP